MKGFLNERNRQDEWMDDPAADPEQLRKSLGYLRRMNALLGYTRSTLGHLHRFSKGWSRDEKIRIIDFATGSADVPRAILRWADHSGFDVTVVGIDLHAQTARAALHESADPRLRIVQADVLHLPFEPGSFDYALTALFLHHLDTEAAVEVLAAMGRVARRGIIAADLLRHYRAYAWISVLSLFANPMVRHDARVSVAQAYTKSEVLEMRRRAGVTFAAYHRHFGHRFALAGEKQLPAAEEA